MLDCAITDEVSSTGPAQGLDLEELVQATKNSSIRRRFPMNCNSRGYGTEVVCWRPNRA